jgi:2,3-bisphosphoglycerate-independent phosphoglycerate mutase
MNDKVILLIMDGWGLGNNPSVSAIHSANTPFYDDMIKKYPNSTLIASGVEVGLPKNQMGNSEVGHMNIGAGRIVNQDLIKLNKSLKDKGIKNNKTFVKAVDSAIQKGNNFHLIGLLSDGGVHSHSKHLYYILDYLKDKKLKNIFLHVFTDGRDASPKKGVSEIQKLQGYIKNTNIKIATVSGRYYSMDRDNRWERIKLAYDAIVNGMGESSTNLIDSIKKSYDNSITDEFIKPLVCVDENNNCLGKIENGDMVFAFNYRSDRMRQLSYVLSQDDFLDYSMEKKTIDYLTMTNYDDKLENAKVLFRKDNLKNTLGEVLEKYNKSQLRIAETEKYAHVTFFFSGGREILFKNESRILCNSPSVPTYDLKPQMSAEDLSDKFISEINNKSFDFACLNFANPDMVGHTGDFKATVQACEKVDMELKKIVLKALKNNYQILVTADHGNAEVMINEDGSLHTYHTTNLVPLILISNNIKNGLKDGKLGDIAPTVLELMNIEKPVEMTGNSLLN